MRASAAAAGAATPRQSRVAQAEIQALFAQNYKQHISEETATEFVEQTGGWITGMVLSILTHFQHPDDRLDTLLRHTTG